MRPILLLSALLAWLLAGPLAAAEAVLRPGEPLTRETVEDLIAQALQAQGGGGEVAVDVQTPPLPLPNRAATPMRITVAEVRLEPGTGRYRARLLARLDGGKAAVIDSAGRVQEAAQVMVPARMIARGEIIAQGDLAARSVPAAQLREDTLRRAEDLLGFSAVRALMPGKLVRAGDVAAPRLVDRGEPVVMVYRQGGLELTGSGIALERGHLGHPIRVQNAASGEVRSGRVVGRKRVEIETGENTP